tara:strand:+ start:319 stop:519 length:201 start_codon:yes stop_codon:yes gene_type:complete
LISKLLGIFGVQSIRLSISLNALLNAGILINGVLTAIMSHVATRIITYIGNMILRGGGEIPPYDRI